MYFLVYSYAQIFFSLFFPLVEGYFLAAREKNPNIFPTFFFHFPYFPSLRESKKKSKTIFVKQFVFF